MAHAHSRPHAVATMPAAAAAPAFAVGDIVRVKNGMCYRVMALGASSFEGKLDMMRSPFLAACDMPREAVVPFAEVVGVETTAAEAAEEKRTHGIGQFVLLSND
jgi:hypothetical protein